MCDAICLVNRGRNIVQGPVREIKRNFMQGMRERKIALEAENLNGQLEATLIKNVTARNHHLELTLHDGANPQELLQRLLTAGALIHRFELVEPTLNEIFIASVERTNNPVEPRRMRNVADLRSRSRKGGGFLVGRTYPHCPTSTFLAFRLF
ncbi:MAG: DUF4162 domain-containing protein [Blastocatellia bacterium]